MRQMMKKRFHIVREGETRKNSANPAPVIDPSVEELERQVRDYRKKTRIRMLAGILAVILVLVGIYLFIHLQTYTEVRIIDLYKLTDAANCSYKEFGKGVLKYSRDGIALVDRKGEEMWNQSYQMQNPNVYVFDKTAVISDKGGNAMVVVDETGVKGEIETTLPIEKAVVSSQGIVAAILKGDGTPQILCYDAAGNILAELDTNMTGNGYPLDIALSENGEVLLVSYVAVENGETVTKIYGYNFGDAGSKKENFEVLSDTYENVVAPMTFFMDKQTSVVVANDRLLLYKGEEVPKLEKTVALEKEIKSAFYSRDYIGLVLKNEGEAGYELCLYNKNGSRVMSEKFTGDYGNIKIDGMQVIMYDGTRCSVFTRTGIHKFKGEMEDGIYEMFPVLGVNKYIVMNANGMQVVRFVK